MRKKQYENYKKLKEDDIPIVRDGAEFLTPEKIYIEKKRMTVAASTQPDWELLEKRLEKKLEKGMLMTVYEMTGMITPKQQLEEVKSRTAIGYKFLLAEHGLLQYLMSYE